jgi:hypothetical protein
MPPQHLTLPLNAIPQQQPIYQQQQYEWQLYESSARGEKPDC